MRTTGSCGRWLNALEDRLLMGRSEAQSLAVFVQLSEGLVNPYG
ncbi:MAG TPA: hypothetical protein VJ548_02645 [Azospira sp.]|nr:hypothetical protein [Azospira sp.]